MGDAVIETTSRATYRATLMVGVRDFIESILCTLRADSGIVRDHFVAYPTLDVRIRFPMFRDPALDVRIRFPMFRDPAGGLYGTPPL